MWTPFRDQRLTTVLRTVERSRLKCGQYWPLDEETAEDHGDFIVINNNVDKRKDYTVTHLLIQNIKVRSHFQRIGCIGKFELLVPVWSTPTREVQVKEVFRFRRRSLEKSRTSSLRVGQTTACPARLRRSSTSCCTCASTRLRACAIWGPSGADTRSALPSLCTAVPVSDAQVSETCSTLLGPSHGAALHQITCFSHHNVVQQSLRDPTWPCVSFVHRSKCTKRLDGQTL